MSKVPIHTQILYDRHQDFTGVEIYLDENLETFEPLSKYIDAERLMEIGGIKMSMPVQKLDAHVTLYDYSQQYRPQTSNQNTIQQIYQDVKREVRPQSKGFNTRSYSAFTKKRKQ